MTNPVTGPGLSATWEWTLQTSERSLVRDENGMMFVIAHILMPVSIDATERYNRDSDAAVFADLGNERDPEELSPGHPHMFVDNMLMTYPVGGLQRREIEQWRGLQPGSFDYNEIPTSSCQSFCWKARH